MAGIEVAAEQSNKEENSAEGHGSEEDVSQLHMTEKPDPAHFPGLDGVATALKQDTGHEVNTLVPDIAAADQQAGINSQGGSAEPTITTEPSEPDPQILVNSPPRLSPDTGEYLGPGSAVEDVAALEQQLAEPSWMELGGEETVEPAPATSTSPAPTSPPTSPPSSSPTDLAPPPPTATHTAPPQHEPEVAPLAPDTGERGEHLDTDLLMGAFGMAPSPGGTKRMSKTKRNTLNRDEAFRFDESGKTIKGNFDFDPEEARRFLADISDVLLKEFTPTTSLPRRNPTKKRLVGPGPDRKFFVSSSLKVPEHKTLTQKLRRKPSANTKANIIKMVSSKSVKQIQPNPQPAHTPSPAITQVKASTSASLQNLRNKVLRELVETETDYVAYLEVLVNNFILPLRRKLQPRPSGSLVNRLNGIWNSLTTNITWPMVEQMFPSIEAILDIHATKFLPRLRKLAGNFELEQESRRVLRRSSSSGMPELPHAAQEYTPLSARGTSHDLPDKVKVEQQTFEAMQWEVSALAHFFVQQGELLLVYEDFVNAFEQALALIVEHKNDPLLAQLQTQAFSKGLGKNQTLYSLMIMPIQRICRYHLFLAQMSKFCKGDVLSLEKLNGATQLLATVKVEFVLVISEERQKRSKLEKELQETYGLENACDLLANPRVLVASYTLDHPSENERVTLHLFDSSPLVLVCVEHPILLLGVSHAVWACLPSELVLEPNPADSSAGALRLNVGGQLQSFSYENAAVETISQILSTLTKLSAPTEAIPEEAKE